MIHLMSKMSLADDQQKDKLWEIKTWVEQLRNRFIEIPPKLNHAVNEIMVPFKLKSSGSYQRCKENTYGSKEKKNNIFQISKKSLLL